MKLKWLMPIVLLAVVASACGNPGPGNSGPTTGTGQTEEQPPADVKEKQTIQVFYTDDQLLELTPRDAEIEFSNEQEKIEAALRALQQNSADNEISLWEHAIFNSVTIKDGDVTVDLSLPEEARLGAPGELLALEAIQNTVFQFDEVKTLDLLLDGQAVESLMGHEELEHPFKKSNGEEK
ncbi:GerMN domain-containing protein [Paenibacillus sp. GCM10012307]|uniref:GerMN domain-containing protein n=1 Tax=Paenibacillus roseus TaxID=2798579 RepID=A0A934JAR1_9BACL|nr:GerMN domain-containing protein [Paenibacillus roseus]MBJ6363592.1 GerMN domain-containing protein [Paenibacillus roseus]